MISRDATVIISVYLLGLMDRHTTQEGVGRHETVHVLAASGLASFPGRFCGGEEKRPGHHCWRMRVVPIKTWEFVHVCALSAYTLVISRNISVHDYECLSVLLQLRER